MKSNLINVIGIALLLFSCGKGGDFYSAVQIHYVDKLGNELFTNGLNGYFKDSLNVYDYNNGVKQALPISSQSAYFSGWTNNAIVISGSINGNVKNQYTLNVIHLKLGVDDTLKIHLTKNSQSGALYDSIWYNGVLKKDTMTIAK